ncbi:membrane-spanning 4-domains subfamily A member 4A-like isoform X2 [Alligator sinensis]|uniref:Membrane-spanning 4-domains subfamily A member 4A-like isoform X2 n=1 Tax=Alligator sinensis TaxID=38654 RepID=A0A3Q0FVL1_ALLSI|nr:membrane-spanning 4-domains subfamily A member 4A-like isoform X2 [Alligator sinensis]
MEQGAPGTILLTQISPPSTRPKPLEKFQRGEPLAVGVTQVLTGIQQVAFGTVLILTFDFHYPALHLGAVVCTGLLMKMELALNSVSTVVAGVSIVMLCLSVMFTHNAHSCYWHQGKRTCDYPPTEVQDILLALSLVLMALTLLQLCLALTRAAFGCKAICRDSYLDLAVVIYQDTARPTDPTCTATSGTL